MVLVLAIGVLALRFGGGSAGATLASARNPVPASVAGAPPGRATLVAYADRRAARLYGWTGSQPDCLLNLWDHESGWRSVANTAGSGAFGVAQALGHGTAATQGSQSDAYGGYGVSDAVARAANSGNERAQVAWGEAYISIRWHDPCSILAVYCANTPSHPIPPGGGCWY
jgi:hypothetical protein